MAQRSVGPDLGLLFAGKLFELFELLLFLVELAAVQGQVGQDRRDAVLERAVLQLWEACHHERGVSVCERGKGEGLREASGP